MKHKLLRPNQIITLRDYPLYNPHILKIYFRVFSKNQGKILPPCPVIHKSSGVPFVKGKKAYNALLANFLDKHPKAEYFLLDGSHKTTAACLSKKLIPVVIIEKDEDFMLAKKLIEKGEFFGWYSVEKSIKEALNVLAKHHFGAKKFLTVEDKAKLMVKNRDVPDYMISFFKK